MRLQVLICGILVALLTGCVARHNLRMPINLSDAFSHHEAQAIIDSTHKGMDQLMGCTYLMGHYPDEYDRLLRLYKRGIKFKFVSDRDLEKYYDNIENGGKVLCGQARLYGDTVEVTKQLFAPGKENPCAPWTDIPHEILHLLGFSHPKGDSNQCKEFHNIMFRCGF